MPTFGLTATGFLPKTLEDIRADINTKLVAFFGPSIDQRNGLLARLVGIISERYAELWQLAEAIVSAQNPDAATATALEQLCLLTGTFRQEATYSTVTLTLTGTVSTVVAAASKVSALSTSVQFQTIASATIAALPAWLVGTAYVVGTRVTNNGRAYVCITPGIGGTGPTTTAADITSGTAHFRYMGDGVGAIDVDAQSIDKGPIVAVSGDLTVRNTPVGGWSGVINLKDAAPGLNDQTDESLRLTREEELSQAGTSTADAILAALRQVDGVTSVTVFVNDTDLVDVDGMLPHSVEALVRGGDASAIAGVLLAQIAAGVQTVGNTSATATDSEGTVQTLNFTRPVEMNIGVVVTLMKDPATYPADGDAQVEAAVIAYGNAQKCGKDAVPSALSAQAFRIAGVLDVTSVNLVGVLAPTTPPFPTLSFPVAIAPRQLAVYDTSWTSITSTNGVP